MTLPTSEKLLDIFWEESYPGAPFGPLALEPKEVYTDHTAGITAVRDAILDALIQEAEKRDISISYFGETDVTEKDGTTRTVVGFADGHLDTWLKSFKDQP